MEKLRPPLLVFFTNNSAPLFSRPTFSRYCLLGTNNCTTISIVVSLTYTAGILFSTGPDQLPWISFSKVLNFGKASTNAAVVGCFVADWEQLNLLPGEANIIFEGTYTGKSYIDPNAAMDTLNLTLGKDKRIVIKKEKLKDFSSVKFLGSNKKQVFTYEITVKNNKKEAIEMLLKDQYPLSTNKDIEVELTETTAAANNAELGVLTWKLHLGPGEIRKMRVSYSVKYPKDKYINL